uniref:Uncharacterized protein n=1 Tax=Plectus sambesii TaxID=2011161 RepID=A0A914UQ52_9BILA
MGAVNVCVFLEFLFGVTSMCTQYGYSDSRVSRFVTVAQAAMPRGLLLVSGCLLHQPLLTSYYD